MKTTITTILLTAILSGCTDMGAPIRQHNAEVTENYKRCIVIDSKPSWQAKCKRDWERLVITSKDIPMGTSYCPNVTRYNTFTKTYYTTRQCY